MTIVRQNIVYPGPGGPFEGVVSYDDAVETRRPGILVLPNVLGQKEDDSVHADRLAGLGYVGFVADLYGQDKRTTRQSENPALYMNQLNADRVLLRERLQASLDQLRAFPSVDPGKVAAIGFCFGGKCVLDLARNGQDILGGVSFHGVFDRPPFANVTPIRARLLICHGWDDPLGPPAAVAALAQELTESGADWQLLAHGHAGHGFTDISLKGGVHPPGFGYDAHADQRSWQAMTHFLAELFGY